MSGAWRSVARVALLGLGGCSLLVEWHDKEADALTSDAGFEAGSIRPDGGGTASDGGSTEFDGSVPQDGAVEPADVVTPFTCAGKPDGTLTDRGNDRFRCCAGVETDIGTNTNCGGCNVVCNAGSGHSCQSRRGHFVCVGCKSDGGGGDGACWSQCCEAPFGSPDGVCVPAFPCGTPICMDDTCKNTAGQASGCDTDAIDFPYCHY